MVAITEDRHYAVLGAFVVTAITAFTLLFVAATSRSLSERRTDLWIVLPTAEGLRKGDAVLLRGVQVGEVRRIDFRADGAVAVKTVLTRSVPLTSAARARLVAADVFGRQSVVLDHVVGGQALMSGDTLHGTPPVSLTGRIEGVASRIERVVGDTTVDAVHGLLAQATDAIIALEVALRTTQQLVTAQQQPLTEVMTASAGIAANLRTATDSSSLLELRETLQGTVAQIERTAVRIDSATLSLTRSFERLEHGQGSMGLLLSDATLYERTAGALASLEELLTDVRQNPRRYINVRVF